MSQDQESPFGDSLATQNEKSTISRETDGFLDRLRIAQQQSQSDIENNTTVNQQSSAEKSTDLSIGTSEASAIDHSASIELSIEARKALVSLLKHGVILAFQKNHLFAVICRYQNSIRRHLSEVFLQLVLDEKAGVAFIASYQSEYQLSAIEENDTSSDEDTASLITRRTLSLYDTLLLLVLRKHYQDREAVGEQKIIIDVERIESYLTPFLSLTNSTRSDRRKLNAALQKMVAKKILASIRGSDDRFEITPIIRYVVNAEFLETMLNEYGKIARETGVALEEPKVEINNTTDDRG